MSSSGTESDYSASSDVDFDDYGEFGYQNIRKKNSDKWKSQRVPNVGKSRTIHVRTTQIGAHAQNAFHYLCRRNTCAAMNFHLLDYKERCTRLVAACDKVYQLLDTIT